MSASQLQIRELGLKRFPRTLRQLQEAIEQGVAPGFVVGYWDGRHPDEVLLGAWGSRRLEPSMQPMEIGTIFDFASVTKVFATAALAGVLVERGWLGFDTPVQSIFPEFEFSEIQVGHLLSHTAGYAAWAPIWEMLRTEFAPVEIESVSVTERQKKARNWVLQVRPEVTPGSRTLYSDISFILLGFVLEQVTQMPLDQAVKKFVWDPMGIEHSYFKRVTQSVTQFQDPKVAATENCPWRGGVLQGQVHDDNCWAMGGFAGHAGAFGDARNLLQFAKKLCSGFLSSRVLKPMWTRVSEPEGCERTLGWDTPSKNDSMLGSEFSRRAVGHWGFTGTSLWIDPEQRFAVTLLSNRVHPNRDNTQMKAFRPRFHDAFIQDLHSGL